MSTDSSFNHLGDPSSPPPFSDRQTMRSPRSLSGWFLHATRNLKIGQKSAIFATLALISSLMLLVLFWQQENALIADSQHRAASIEVDPTLSAQAKSQRISEVEAHIRSLRIRTYLILATVALFFFATWFTGVLTVREIIRKLELSGSIFDRISQGHFDNRITVAGRDEIDGLLRRLKTMQERLKSDILEEKRLSRSNARIKAALDSATTNVLLLDAAGTIIYANNAFRNHFRQCQQQICKTLPSFNVDTMIGAPIDSFNLPALNLQSLSGAIPGKEYRLDLGELKFRYVVSRVHDENGEQSGIVMEWKDYSEQEAIEDELHQLIESAQAGDLGQRLDLQKHHGFLKRMGEGINALIEINESFIDETIEVVSAMARGDISRTLQGDYSGDFGRLKEHVNQTVCRLRDIISKIRQTTDFLREDAYRIAQGNNELRQRSEEQASSLEQSAASLEEITGTVKNNAINAHEANTTAEATRQKARDTEELVKQTIEAMAQICRSSRKISDITGVIDEIAFQTNLLALNAAVEAAHAGDQGQGFAVVAAEVRELAQRSSEAAREIKLLIEESGNKVMTGTELVNRSGESLQEIIEDVSIVAAQITQITQAGDEQTIGIEMINRSINEIDAVTQQNKALGQQTALASQDLCDKTRELASLVDFFRAQQPAAVDLQAA